MKELGGGSAKECWGETSRVFCEGHGLNSVYEQRHADILQLISEGCVPFGMFTIILLFILLTLFV